MGTRHPPRSHVDATRGLTYPHIRPSSSLLDPESVDPARAARRGAKSLIHIAGMPLLKKQAT